eukprot:scaffold101622_cov31-Tisochrysis_lutea.AAC.2
MAGSTTMGAHTPIRPRQAGPEGQEEVGKWRNLAWRARATHQQEPLHFDCEHASNRKKQPNLCAKGGGDRIVRVLLVHGYSRPSRSPDVAGRLPRKTHIRSEPHSSARAMQPQTLEKPGANTARWGTNWLAMQAAMGNKWRSPQAL